MTRSKKPHASELALEAVLADPRTTFCVTRRLGVSAYDKRPAATLAEAEAMGTGDRRQLLYAIDHLKNSWVVKVL